MERRKSGFAKIVNKLVFCLLIGVMFVFAGCYSGGSNNIGNNNNNNNESTPPDNRPPPTVEVEPDPDENRGYNGKYQELESLIDGVRIVFKKDARTVEDRDYIKQNLAKSIDDLSVEIVKGLIVEYGPRIEISDEAAEVLDVLGVPYVNTNPFVAMNYAAFGFTYGGVAATSAQVQQFDKEIQQISKIVEFNTTNFVLEGHDGMTNGLKIEIDLNGDIKLERTTWWEVVKIENLQSGEIFAAETQEVNEFSGTSRIVAPSQGAYRFEFKSPGNKTFVSFAIIGYSDFKIDTHADAIRVDNWLWNDLSVLDEVEDEPGVDKNDRYLYAWLVKYKDMLKADILRIMVFGDLDIPSDEIVVKLKSEEGYEEFTYNPLQEYTTIINNGGGLIPNPLVVAAMDRFLDFAAIYLDHWGLSAGEADGIAEYIMSNIIGADLIEADDQKILPGGTTIEGTVTYNTNQAVFNGDTIVKYRKLIDGYSEIDLRAGLEEGGYNDVFSKIRFATETLDYYDNDAISYDGNFDKSMPGFKNYRTTVYAVMHQIKQKEKFRSRGILEYLDVSTGYMNGPDDMWGEDSDEDNEDGTNEFDIGDFGEFDINPDPYITGRMQSIILMPNTAFELSYIGLGLMPTTKPVTYPQPQYSYLEPAEYDEEDMWGEGEYENADKLKINSIFRYHKWDEGSNAMTVYECIAPVSEIFVVVDEWGLGPGDIWEVEFDITVLQFISPDGQLLDNNNFAIELDEFAGHGANEDGEYDFYSENIGVGREVITPDEFDEYFEENEYSTGARPSYVSEYTGFSYFEIAFSAELNGRPYDFMYGLQIVVSQICGLSDVV